MMNHGPYEYHPHGAEAVLASCVAVLVRAIPFPSQISRGERTAAQECRRLRQELTAQQQEERHLSGRVEQLEGCLRARTRQLDRLLQSMGGAEPMVPDQDRHADSFPRSQSAQLRVRVTAARKESEQRLESEDCDTDPLDPPLPPDRATDFRHVLRARVGTQSLRQEFAALHEQEKDRRAAAKTAVTTPTCGAVDSSVGDNLRTEHDESDQAGTQLQQELQALRQKCANLEESCRKANDRADEAQQELLTYSAKAEAAEQRAWAMAEAANELALLADLRHVEVLEVQLRLQEKLTAAEHRCQDMESVAHDLALRYNTRERLGDVTQCG
eukprot:s1460_g6.t1